MPRARRINESIDREGRRAIALIEARCGEFDLDLSAIAADLACSSRQVQRLLCHFGTTFRIELMDARMRRGAEQLLRPRTSVSRAADLAGYRHARHFSTAFQAYFGLRPSAVRQAGRVADRLRRRASMRAPDPRSPRYSAHFRRWRADHRMLVKLLLKRHAGTVLDDLFADALRLLGPDLRTREGRARAKSLRDRRGPSDNSTPSSGKRRKRRRMEAIDWPPADM